MLNMNIEWDNQPKGYQRHGHSHQRQPENKGLFGGLFGGKKEEDRQTGHVYYYSSSRPNAPRRAETMSTLPKGVKMPTGDKPEVSYGADGSKYLVIPRRSSSSSRPRQIIVTSGHTTPPPRRQDSTGSRATPQRSSSTTRPKSPPVSGSHRAPKIIGDPELVKQYENSQRSVARWVESVNDGTSSGRPAPSRRTTTR